MMIGAGKYARSSLDILMCAQPLYAKTNFLMIICLNIHSQIIIMQSDSQHQTNRHI